MTDSALQIGARPSAAARWRAGRSGPRVAVIEHREAGADYVLSFMLGLHDVAADSFVIATPQLSQKADRLGRSRDVDSHPYFTLKFRGGASNLWPYARGWARTFALLARRRPDVVHVQWLVKPGPESRIFPLLCRMLGARLVYTAHNVLPHEPSAGDEAAYGRMYRGCDRVIVHTGASRAEIIERFDIDPDRVVVVPHGNQEHRVSGAIDPAAARGALGLDPERPVVLFLGKLREYKGVTDLVEAFRRSSAAGGAQLLIAGHPDDEEYGRRLRALADGDPRVVLIDRYLTESEMEQALAAADVVALPYLEIDQSGILFYAMTAGRAILASRLDGFVEAMAGRDAALFHEPRDPADLERGLTRLLTDDALRSELGRAARTLAVENHSWDAIARRTLDVYSEAAA